MRITKQDFVYLNINIMKNMRNTMQDFIKKKENKNRCLI